VAALFAVHPLHVESVAWVAERKDVLSTFFGLLALYAYAAYSERRNATRYAAVAVAFAASLAAKPMLVTLPFVFLLLDVWPLRRIALSRASERDVPAERPTRVLLEKVPLLALSIASSVVTYAAQERGDSIMRSFPVSERVAHAFEGYVWYLAKTLWPTSLSPFYPLPSDSALRWSAAAAAAVIALLTCVAVTQRGRRPYLVVGWLWFLGTLVPVIGLVKVGSHLVADRYAYVPIVGLFIAATWAAADAASRFRRAGAPLLATALAILTALGAASWVQVAFWRDGETLFTRAIQVTSDNWIAHNQLGRDRLERDPAGAAELFSRALEMEPGAFIVWANLGLAHRKLGNTDAQIAAFRRASELRPTNARVRFDLGYALIAGGHLNEAVAEYAHGLSIDPGDAPAHYNLAYALQRLGRTTDARSELELACRLSPDDPRLCARPP
jgi:tetratricopeptide (TPR) repeat protein